MSVTLEIPFRAAVRSPRSAEATLAYLADWKRSVGDNFVGLKRFEETSPGVFQWQFEEVGYQSFKLAIEFATRMGSGPQAVEAVPHSGPHQLTLRWTVRPEGAGSHADLDLRFVVDLPVPGLMKGLVSGFARTELTKLLERYAANVEKALAK